MGQGVQVRGWQNRAKKAGRGLGKGSSGAEKAGQGLRMQVQWSFINNYGSSQRW